MKKKGKILEIHSRKRHYSEKTINFKEFARMTEEEKKKLLI
jgi:hypothetical protein